MLVACGGDSGTSPAPVPTPTPPPPPAPVIVSQGSSSLRAGFLGRVFPFTTTRAGTLDATVDWTFASNDVDAAITRGDCSLEQFMAVQCQVVAFAVSTTAKPERLMVSGAAPGTYTLFIENAGPTDESVAWQVVLTPSASSASVANGSGQALPEKFRQSKGRVELR
jgi:hypothetical protein